MDKLPGFFKDKMCDFYWFFEWNPMFVSAVLLGVGMFYYILYVYY